ncbi:C40 family peptidase [Paenibacillus pinihumi]|uniref:C40 family peptidase n=1 Tax=Paenibacillus pinihumi TaxID=669462 RepID=UPI00042992FE|nr:C40 family peptidase [Paenibacillus pinihumi]
MNPVRVPHAGKWLAAAGLSLTLMLSGSLAGALPAAYAATNSTSKANTVISTGKQFLGVDYKFGATSGRTDEFDCSSFTQYVFKKIGIDLPRTSKEQAKEGVKVSRDQLQPGDLIFSDTNRDGVINHVGIYMGNDKTLQTYRKGIGVTISDFSGSVWDDTFVTARRVIKNDSPSTGSDNSSSGDQQNTGSGKPNGQDTGNDHSNQGSQGGSGTNSGQNDYGRNNDRNSGSNYDRSDRYNHNNWWNRFF